MSKNLPIIRICLFLFVTLFTFTSCKNEAPVDEPEPEITVDPDPDPVQYGVPFTGVPDAADAVIYQVNMRSFSTTRNFQGVIARLDSIKALGANVVYLMPVYPVGSVKSVNSPYCVKDYKAVNAEFGTLTDLRSLIDGAHSRGMAVILDWVANHTSWDNAWLSNTGWYQHDANGAIVSPNGWTDVAQLNFSNTDMRKAMIKALKYWVFTANCDGFRCDYADGPPADFWKQAIDTLRNIKSHKLLMMAEGSRADHFVSGFDLSFGFKFYDQLKAVYGTNQPATGFDNVNGTEYAAAGTKNRVVRYVTNHDVNSSDGTPLDLFGGVNGSMSAFIVAAFMKGAPMIYNGQEVGTTYRLNFPFTGTPINWTSNFAVEKEYKKILTFRSNSEAVRRGELLSYSNANICAFTKKSGADVVLVLCNLRNTTSTITLPTELTSMSWKDAFTGAGLTLTATTSLLPYSYLILKN